MYFNYAPRHAADWWGRRALLHSWWRINARDRRWAPPLYAPHARTLLRPPPWLQALAPQFVTLEAVVRPARNDTPWPGLAMPAGMADSIVATLLALTDAEAALAAVPTTFLALMTFANDEETRDRLLDLAWQEAAPLGAVRLVAPADLAPAFSSGLLLDHFNLDPPLHTPYNAPYVPELLAGALEPLRCSRLWHLDPAPMATDRTPPGASEIEIAAFAPARLAADLLPLAQAVAPGAADDPPLLPDGDQMAAALALWAAAPLHGWLAQVAGAPAGFVLLQADVAPALRRLRGGRPLWARPLLAARPPQSASAGRVLLGGVLPAWRGRGIGRALLTAACAHAQRAGWRTLTIGPVAESSPATALLEAVHATPRQRYALYASAE